MKYLVLGAGGTGGPIAAYMTKGGLDVCLIARGEHLERINESGLTLIHENGFEESIPVKAVSMSDYKDNPDVIFVCVKGYSLSEVVPFLKKVTDRYKEIVASADGDKLPIVIPVLNIYGTGERLSTELDCLVTDGCIYVAAQKKAPGVIQMNGDILRIVYGVRKPEDGSMDLFRIREELKSAGIEAIVSDNIQRDALQKFSYVSPMAAAELYYNSSAGLFKQTGEARDFFLKLVREIDALAAAMNIPFLVDVCKNNLAILDSVNDNATTSLHRDIDSGKNNEADGLIFEVLRLADEYNVPVPCYRLVADKIKDIL